MLRLIIKLGARIIKNRIKSISIINGIAM